MIEEELMGMIPYPLLKEYIENKTNPVNNIAVYPESLSINTILNDIEHCIAWIPYCSKPKSCAGMRKTQECRVLQGYDCKQLYKCSIGNLINELYDIGMKTDQIFIIDCDDNLFSWIKQKKEEGYKYFLPGVGCHYGVAYALRYIHEELGFSGVVVYLEGNTCTCKEDYDGMEGEDKGKESFINVDEFKKRIYY